MTSAAPPQTFKEAWRNQVRALAWVEREQLREAARMSADERLAGTLSLCEFAAQLRAKGLGHGGKEKARRATRWQALAEAWRRKCR